ncbi:hypothetical protein EMIT0158MI4_140013 [Burkholderia ambifaria]
MRRRPRSACVERTKSSDLPATLGPTGRAGERVAQVRQTDAVSWQSSGKTLRMECI